MEGRQRRSFTDDYKRQAVDLVASSDRSFASVAKELGLRDSVLRRWLEQREAGLEPSADHAAETDRLQNERLRMERDILKKSIAILEFRNEIPLHRRTWLRSPDLGTFHHHLS